MDLRDIQRLHAQFSPDATTIDLPRQIAALPALIEFGSSSSAPSVRSRWTNAGPLLRGSVIAITGAVVVGMAGMGAASLYKSSRSSAPVTAPSAAAAPEEKEAVHAPHVASLQAKPAVKEIDATPAQPVAAPRLTAGDFATASSLGLTADRFRNSLKTRESAPQPLSTAKSSAVNSSEIDRAANSPIHRAAGPRTPDAHLVAATVPPQTVPAVPATATITQAVAKSTEPVAVQPVPQQAVSVASVPAAPATQSQPPAQAESTVAAAATKVTRASRRHISRPRVEPRTDSETAVPAATPVKSAPANRAGSNEVPMF